MAVLPAPDATRSVDPVAAAAGAAANGRAGVRPPFPLPARPTAATPLTADALSAAVADDTAIDSMILSPILPAGAIALIHGPRGVGLTHVALGCAIAVATGGRFLRWQAPRPAPVLLASGTMSASALAGRIALARTLQPRDGRIDGPIDGRLKVVALGPNCPVMPDLATREGRAMLAALAADCDLVVIDDLAGLLPVGLDGPGRAELWRWLAELRLAGKSAIVLQATGRARRRTADTVMGVLDHLADVVVTLSRPSGYRPTDGARFELSYQRARHLTGPQRIPSEVRLRTRGLGGPRWISLTLGSVHLERFLQMCMNGMSVEAAGSELGVSRTTAYRWAREARLRGELDPVRSR